MKRIIQTKKAPKAVGAYSQAIRADNFIFISGQIPLDPTTGEVIEGNLREQTERVLENIRSILDDSGATLRDVVKTTVYLTNMGDFSAVNEVYSRFFGIDSPARTTVEVSQLPKGVLVEIDAIAWVGNP